MQTMILPPALALVTGALQNLIREALPENTEVTAQTPAEAASSPHESRVNLFLHRIAPSTTARSSPVERAGRAGRGSPALELHYLVTAYGNPTRALGQCEPDLLWAAMNAFHASPALAIPALGKDKVVNIVAEDMDSASLCAFWQATKADYRPALTYRVHLPTLSPVPPPPAASPADVRQTRLERLGANDTPKPRAARR